MAADVYQKIKMKAMNGLDHSKEDEQLVEEVFDMLSCFTQSDIEKWEKESDAVFHEQKELLKSRLSTIPFNDSIAFEMVYKEVREAFEHITDAEANKKMTPEANWWSYYFFDAANTMYYTLIDGLCDGVNVVIDEYTVDANLFSTDDSYEALCNWFDTARKVFSYIDNAYAAKDYSRLINGATSVVNLSLNLSVFENDN